MGKFRCDQTLFKMHCSIQLVTPKDIIQRSKIIKVLIIKRSICDSSNKSHINRDDGNLVKTNTWTPLLREINDLVAEPKKPLQSILSFVKRLLHFIYTLKTTPTSGGEISCK